MPRIIEGPENIERCEVVVGEPKCSEVEMVLPKQVKLLNLLLAKLTHYNSTFFSFRFRSVKTSFTAMPRRNSSPLMSLCRTSRSPHITRPTMAAEEVSGETRWPQGVDNSPRLTPSASREKDSK